MNAIRWLLALLLLGVIAGAAFVWTGVYPIGADVPHYPIVYKILQTLRLRSIALRAAEIQVPPLDDAALVATGAGHYSEMCTGCHLAAGVADSELRRGL